METTVVKEEIVSLINKADPYARVRDDNKDIFTSVNMVAPRDMVVVLIELKKKYGLDLNILFDRLQTYSLNEIAEAVCVQLT